MLRTGDGFIREPRPTKRGEALHPALKPFPVPDEPVAFFVYQDQFVFSETFNTLFNLVGLHGTGIAPIHLAGGDKFPILDIPDPGKAPTRCTPIGMHDFIGGMHAIAMEAVLSVEPIVASSLVSDPGPD